MISALSAVRGTAALTESQPVESASRGGSGVREVDGLV